MPFRSDQPLIRVSGQTACVTFACKEGVSINVSFPAPRMPGADENQLEDAIASAAIVALRSALASMSRPQAADPAASDQVSAARP